MRFFNTAGPVDCARHYCVPPLTRTDLLVVWPNLGGVQRVVIELKVLHGSLESTLAEGLEQTWAYMDACDADAGHLVIFDRSAGKPWVEKIFQQQEAYRGKTVAVWGM